MTLAADDFASIRPITAVDGLDENRISYMLHLNKLRLERIFWHWTILSQEETDRFFFNSRRGVVVTLLMVTVFL